MVHEMLLKMIMMIVTSNGDFLNFWSLKWHFLDGLCTAIAYDRYRIPFLQYVDEFKQQKIKMMFHQPKFVVHDDVIR